MLPLRSRFPRQRRLLKGPEFKAVIENGHREGGRLLTLLALPAVLGPRLGLAISKKAAARAHERNRIKRLIRESFRQNAATLPAVDLVLMARPPAQTADNEALRKDLDQLWRRLRQRSRVSNAASPRSSSAPSSSTSG
ncbi:MAG TPA: ribonuclease P protein component [Nevskiaceae bacterium]|nr:ribonuclease P protein component [Nevskiaceae bacterium]